MIYTDSFFTIGVSHQICQDYALNNNKAACISDGCSSAKFTDWGSRLFCQEYINSTKYHSDIQKISEKVLNDLDLLNLPHEAGFATLFGITAKENGFLIISQGDGYIAGKKYSGEVIFNSFKFTNNMPYYPIYKTLEIEMSEYCPPGSIYLENNNQIDYIYATIPRLELCDYEICSTVAVFSDGVDSFEGISAKEVINKLMDFPLYNGEFVKRRCIKQLKEWREQGIVNSDDFSMAAIHIERDNEQD